MRRISGPLGCWPSGFAQKAGRAIGDRGFNGSRRGGRGGAWGSDRDSSEALRAGALNGVGGVVGNGEGFGAARELLLAGWQLCALEPVWLQAYRARPWGLIGGPRCRRRRS